MIREVGLFGPEGCDQFSMQASSSRGTSRHDQQLRLINQLFRCLIHKTHTWIKQDDSSIRVESLSEVQSRINLVDPEISKIDGFPTPHSIHSTLSMLFIG